MERNNEELTLVEAMAAYPWGVWSLYHPNGTALVEHVPSLALASALAMRQRRGEWVPPEGAVARWQGEGGLMVLLENGEWRKFLRLEEPGERFLTREEVAEWRELALNFGRDSNEMKGFYRRVMGL